MARKLLLIFMGICLAWGVFKCQEARAGRWIKTGTTFDRGWHLACEFVDVDPIDSLVSPTCIIVWCEGTMEEVESYLRVWNDPPGLPDIDVWYKLENGYWIRIVKPFKWIDGVEM